VLALLALFGPKQGLRVPLTSTLVVGRSVSADLQLIDARVSREHCRIEVAADGGLALSDLDSQNGTYVNGRVIQGQVRLEEGDEIAIGDSLLLVAGESFQIANARYGLGTLIASKDAATVRVGVDAQRTPDVETRSLELGPLVGRMAEALGEQAVIETLLDGIEERLVPARTSILSFSATSGRLTVLGARGEKRIVSLSTDLLRSFEPSRRGFLFEDETRSRRQAGERSIIERERRSAMLVSFQRGAGQSGMLYVDRAHEAPFSPDDLLWLEMVGHLASLRLHLPVVAATDSAAAPVGEAPAFRAALERAEAAARVDSTVLLLGETGTGKEELARLIHRRSRRRGSPFVAVNCGAIAEALAESELFGHEKGAFTGAANTRLGAFETAEGGTVFLDEIGDLALPLQVKLLRVLQERAVVRVGASLPHEVDIRIVAATHHDLAREVKAGRFREDLYYRLNVVAIQIPALRERLDDVPLLVPVLLTRIAARLRLVPPALTDDAVAALMEASWVGNVRELGNVLERLLVLRDPSDTEPLDADDVRAALGCALSPVTALAPSEDETLAEAVARVEKSRIESAWRRARGKKSHAAKMLGISRPTLDKKIADLGIEIWRKG
jgi:DNA-binding NtrC family response regulator